MDDKIDDAILLLTSMLHRSVKSEDAMRLTQSALNLAHVKNVLAGVEEEAKPRRGRPPKVAADEA